MRTTILLDDELAGRLQAEARRRGKSFSAFLADAGRKALDSKEQKGSAPFRLVTFRGDGPFEGVNLDRTGELVAADDVGAYRPPGS
jgi:predicted transcriptional regulator